jgi:hypothetical protein
MPVITPVLGRQRQEDHELEASLDYIERYCLKKEKIKRDFNTRNITRNKKVII